MVQNEIGNKKNTFVIDDGTKLIRVENKFGEEICKIHIRGGDIGILDRYNELLQDFDKLVEPLSKVTLKDDGTSSFEDEWNTVKAVENELIQRINKMFDTKDAGNLFATRNAFSTINGEFYAEKVIEMLGNVVAQELAEESDKTKKRLEKYTKDIDNK